MPNTSDNSSILLMLNEEEKMNDMAALIYLSVAVVLGGVGNALVCYIYYFKMTVTAANLFLAVLSFCDFLGSIVCVPLDIIVMINPYTFNNDIGCRIIRFLVMDDIIVTAFVVFAVSADRLRKVILPHHQHLTHRQVGYICAGIAVASSLISLPCFYVYSTQPVTTHRLNMTGMQCTFSGDAKRRILYISFLIFIIILVVVALCLIYCIVGIKLWRYKSEMQSRQNRQGSSASEQEDSQGKDIKCYVDQEEESEEIEEEPKTTNENTATAEAQQRRGSVKPMNLAQATLMVFVISLTWVICCIPYLAALCLLTIYPNMEEVTKDVEHALFKFSVHSFYFNYIANPWIYSIFNFRFREEMLSILQKAKCC